MDPDASTSPTDLPFLETIAAASRQSVCMTITSKLGSIIFRGSTIGGSVPIAVWAA